MSAFLEKLCDMLGAGLVKLAASGLDFGKALIKLVNRILDLKHQKKVDKQQDRIDDICDNGSLDDLLDET